MASEHRSEDYSRLIVHKESRDVDIPIHSHNDASRSLACWTAEQTYRQQVPISRELRKEAVVASSAIDRLQRIGQRKAESRE